MRRPTPLPPLPGATAAPAFDIGSDPVEPVETEDAAQGAATAETAPIPPLRTVDTEPRANAEPAAELGVRDLWRAARARRRALRAEVRRFTARSRRRRAAWLISLGALVLLVLATVGAAYSPLFAVERIEVVGTSQLDPNAVAGALSGQLGTPLAAVDESAVKAAMVAFPLVESYTLEAVPPHDLVVRVVERTPIGVLSSPDGYTLVDAAGVALSTTPDAPAGYPSLEIQGGPGSPAFDAAGRVMRALPPELRGQVTALSATSANDVTLTLAGAQVMWGSADRSAMKALVLETSMRARPGASSYDVSSPDAVVIG